MNLKSWFAKRQKASASQGRPEYITKIEQRIGYHFKNADLLIQALKHRSYLSISCEDSHYSNERLEFLGDAVLDLIITDHLYQKYPTENEGVLSKKKAILVSRSVLAGIVGELELGQYLLLNRGEEKTGGHTRHSNLANLFESLLGAIYLDGGYSHALNFTKTFLISRSADVLTAKTYENYKSKLLEYSQAKSWGYPTYKVVDESGPDHNKRFVVLARVNDKVMGKGTGASKKKAEQMAARNALSKLENG